VAAEREPTRFASGRRSRLGSPGAGHRGFSPPRS
jgi:hypothetical protein